MSEKVSNLIMNSFWSWSRLIQHHYHKCCSSNILININPHDLCVFKVIFVLAVEQC